MNRAGVESRAMPKFKALVGQAQLELEGAHAPEKLARAGWHYHGLFPTAHVTAVAAIDVLRQALAVPLCRSNGCRLAALHLASA